jgi:hypothetical protein
MTGGVLILLADVLISKRRVARFGKAREGVVGRGSIGLVAVFSHAGARKLQHLSHAGLIRRDGESVSSTNGGLLFNDV